MNTATQFRPFQPGQMLLLPPDMRDWLPDDHLVYFILDVVRELDLSEIYAAYNGDKGGQPPFDPRMMVGLLLYGYCVGTVSSRRIEKATQEQVPFRVLTADQHPDHDTIAEFRRRHMVALSGLFLQVLRLCREAGLVRLGHVALDGTKVRANASKHKAMSYGRMDGKIAELEEQIRQLMTEAEAADQAEDARHGKGVRGDERPDELRFRQRRLEKIRQAKAALEAEARQKAQDEQARRDQENLQRKEEGNKPVKHRTEPDSKPQDKAQRNFTDPESRIMKDGASKAFEPCYNGQAVVDDKAQIIVAADVTQQANDKRQIEPMVSQMVENLGGAAPEALTADAGYFSEENVTFLDGQKIDGYIAVGRQKHDPPPDASSLDEVQAGATAKERMAAKLRTDQGRATYRMRKAIVEPVFGQIKSCRGLRRFLLRGLAKVRAEWRLICAGHNLLKLFVSGWAAKPA
jgi:transposase